MVTTERTEGRPLVVRAERDLCAHCARPTRTGCRLEEAGTLRWFCCAGCRAVYLLLRAVREESG